MPNFNEAVERAMSDPGLSGLRPVVEKELLHYDILYALDQEGLLGNLTFQGGTSLRLCYGAQRFSEDLDFVGGQDFAPAQLTEIRKCVEAHIGQRYNLEVSVKEPKQMRSEPTYFGVKTDRWQVTVVTSPGERHIPKQRIKFEVANVEAYTGELRSPVRNYQILPDGYEDILVNTETLSEIMADKIVSLCACTSYIRNRDIWDLQWIGRRGIVPDGSLIEKKVRDYGVSDFEALLNDRLANITDIARSPEFSKEMLRFIAPAERRRSLERKGFDTFLGASVRDILTAGKAGWENAKNGFAHEKDEEPEL